MNELMNTSAQLSQEVATDFVERGRFNKQIHPRGVEFSSDTQINRKASADVIEDDF